jgi:phytoene dehydrogenase-like protein
MPLAEKSLIVVGAGIGGLSAGCYARLSGLDARIFEAHASPGGLCTSWIRRGYTFDGCIHHLAGCRPGSPLYAMWEELGAMPREILFPGDLTQVEGPDGETLTVYTDLDRLEAHMIELFPEDARPIRGYVRALRRFAGHDLLELPLTGYRGLLGHVAVAPTLARWGRTTMRTAAERFRSPFLRRAFPTIQYDWVEIPAIVHVNLLAQCAARNYGFPAGGSLAFARSIEKRFRELGGEITYGACVTRILTERDRAVGVRLDDGSEYRADAVVSNAFERTTLLDLLDRRFVDERARSRLLSPNDEIVMGVHVSLGVDRDLSGEPHALVLLLDEPVAVGDRRLDRLPVDLYGFDPSLAPPGKGVIKVLLDTSYAHWRDLSEDRSRYAEAKEEVARRIIDLLEPRFPGLSGQIDVVDVATPMTTERFTGNGRTPEASQGFSTAMLFSRPRAIPELRRFYWIGQSAGGAGIPGCAAMGRNAVRGLCRQLRVAFGGRPL